MRRPPGVPRARLGGSDGGAGRQNGFGSIRRFAVGSSDTSGSSGETGATGNGSRGPTAARGTGSPVGELAAAFGTGKLLAVAVAGTVVLAAAGGAVYFSGREDPAIGLDDVPAGVDAVAYVDAERMTDDPAIGRAVDGALRVAGGESVPSDHEALLAAFENGTGLDIEKLRTVLAYANYADDADDDAPDYAGAILRSEWERTAVASALEDERNGSYEAGEYRDATVYRPADEVNRSTMPWLGVLAPGIYVVGTPAAVEDALDVAAGESDSVGGEVATAFREARGGYAKVASKVPAVDVGLDELPLVGAVDAGPLADIETVGAAYYTDGNTLGVEATLYAADESAADSVADVIDGSLSLASLAATDESLESTIRAIEIERDGTAVTVTLENAVEDITAALEALRNRSEDGGDGPLAVAAPAAGVRSPGYFPGPLEAAVGHHEATT